MNKEELNKLAKLPEFENKSLSELRTNILHEFTSREVARGIIFTRTRRSAIALSQWIQENPKFEEVGVKACHVIGGGDQSVVKPMTSVCGVHICRSYIDYTFSLAFYFVCATYLITQLFVLYLGRAKGCFEQIPKW